MFIQGMAMTSQVNMITQHWQTLCHSLESVYLSLVFFLNGQCLFCKLLMQSNFLPIILTWTGIPTRKKKQLQVSTSVAGRTAKTQVIEYIESGELRKYDYYTNASWASWGSWWTRACKKKFLLKQFRTGFKS